MSIESALKDIPGIQPEFVEGATVELLNEKLIPGADIFHFAGHGKFKQSVLDTSGGYIVLLGKDGKSTLMSAEQLAMNLRERGVQLVFLGACETGRRDEQNVWSGVVTALMGAGIPAAVAMQYKIWDQSAIALSQSFYKALAAGLPLDQAVSLARIAVFNLCDSIKDELQRQSFWRDWGVPVLYCRVKENFVLPAVKDEEQRQDLLDELTNVQKNPKLLQIGKYNINMEKAEGIAIGDGAQVIKTEMRGNGNKQKDDQSG